MTLAMCEKIQLSFRAEKLKDEDILSKSDPFILLTDDAKRREVGRTEVIKDNLNPNWTTLIAVDYFFESKQTMKVNVWDFDSDGQHDLLGTATFTLGQLMSSRNSTLELPLQPQGKIIVTGLHEGKIKGSTSGWQFRGKNLKNMDTFSKSDPFFILSRIFPSGEAKQLYKSEVIDNNLNPLWKTMPNIDLSILCGGDLNAKVLKFECFDEDLTENEAMGCCVFSVNDLIAPPTGGSVAQQQEFMLTDPKNPSSTFGYILLDSGSVAILPNFLDLLKAGLQLNIAFSVDFTGSNMECKNPKSLHFYHPTQPNQYIQSMLAVSDVVQEYDSDRQFPCFGFGAVLPNTHEANHFFHLNLGPNPYISGMQAVIDTYVQTMQQIRFYGPTNFAPTIRNVANGARQAPGVYTILLIMTDGEITDMDDTINEIVQADDAPFSILIVGVGSADFSSMERLDSDTGALSSRGRVSRRDIVQFVPMRDYANRGGADLAAALLAEIPPQVSKWALMNPEAVKQFGAAGATRPAAAAPAGAATAPTA